MWFGSVWIDFEKSIQNSIRFGGFHKRTFKYIQKYSTFCDFRFFVKLKCTLVNLVQFSCKDDDHSTSTSHNEIKIKVLNPNL
jgi:hypothetical protein